MDAEPDGTYVCLKCGRNLQSKQGAGKHEAWHLRMEQSAELGEEARAKRYYNKIAPKINPINDYLRFLQEPKKRGGTNLTVDELNARIATAFDNGYFLRAAELTAIRHNKEAAEPEKLEQYFIEHAAEYSTEKGITAAVWREFGVPARVLKEAGIK